MTATKSRYVRSVTDEQPRQPMLTAVLGVLWFGAGCVLAIVRDPIAGGAGVIIGGTVGGTIYALLVRARRAAQPPPRFATGAFLVAFVASLLMFFLVPPLGLGCLSAFFTSSAIVLFVWARSNKPAGKGG